MALVFALADGPAAWATDVVRQRISLRQGWNAVHLKVQPADSAPAVVFAGLPVAKVAAYFPRQSPVEFIQDPGSADWKQEGWSVWFADTQPEAPLSDLYAIPGGQGYLVLATAPATWEVEGRVVFRPVRWRADSYNFVGFAVDPDSPPTFAQWFAGSPAHQPTRRPLIYRLDATGHWTPVDRRDTTVIEPDAACWVFCQGGSEYQGPLEATVLRSTRGGGLDFGKVTETLTLRLRNPGPAPLGFTLELTPEGVLPLSYERRLPALGQTARLGLTSPTGFPPLEPGGELDVRITLDRAQMAAAEAVGLLAVRDEVGGLVRIPVKGQLP